MTKTKKYSSKFKDFSYEDEDLGFLQRNFPKSQREQIKKALEPLLEGMKKEIYEENLEIALELYEEGYTLPEISKKMNIDVQAIYNYIKELETPVSENKERRVNKKKLQKVLELYKNGKY